MTEDQKTENEAPPPQQVMVIPEPPQAPPAPRTPMREMLEILKSTDPKLVEQFASAIIAREVAAVAFEQDSRLARSLAMSGLFTNISGGPVEVCIAKAVTIVQLGRSWGMEPADALQYIDFFSGRPSVRNEYIAAKIQAAGISWDIQWYRDGDECTGCALLPTRRQPDGSYTPIMETVNDLVVRATVTFRKADARRSTTKENGKVITLDQKSTYQAYPEDMYFWKCIARLRKRYCPHVMMPGVADIEDEQPAVELLTALPAPAPLPEPAVAPARQAAAAGKPPVIPGTQEPRKPLF